MNRKNKFIIHVIFPMLIGGLIYILFREQNLLMFNWFSTLGLDSLISYLRNRVLFANIIPIWFKYSVPDGIWIYSLTSLMLIIWYEDFNKSKYFWVLIGPLLGLSVEFGQLINIIPGTYDNTDIIFCILASIIPFYIINQNKKRILQ